MKTFPRLLVSALLVLSACESKEGGGAPPALQGKLEIFGSGTAALLVAPIADSFRKKEPGVTITLQESSSSWGIGYLRQGMTDMAMSIRALPPGEKDLTAHPIARDGLCLILHETNPVAGLSDDQVAGIFKGTIKNWKEVGGKDAEITRINHAEVRATLAMFVDYLKLQPSDIKYTDIVISSDKEAIQHVSSQPDAITYIGIASALGALEKKNPIKLVGFRGVPPTVENVEKDALPITYDVSLVTKGAPQGVPKAFIEFATSPEIAPIVKERHFAPKK